jgi:hypothetical protein
MVPDVTLVPATGETSRPGRYDDNDPATTDDTGTLRPLPLERCAPDCAEPLIRFGDHWFHVHGFVLCGPREASASAPDAGLPVADGPGVDPRGRRERPPREPLEWWQR